jgi:hypothetical protein
LRPNRERRLRLVALAAGQRRLLQKQAAAQARSLRLAWLAVSLAGVPLASVQRPPRLHCLPPCVKLKMPVFV